MKKNLSTVLFMGASWGIFEASVGYLIHLAGIGVGWMIWFPVAYFFVHQTYRRTDSISSVMLMASIAASLKLVNLFFYGPIDRVINPAASIIIEALSIMLVYKYIVNKQADRITPYSIMLTGFTWRALYICYIFIMPQAYLDKASFITMPSFLEYMFFKNIVNAAFISLAFFAAKVFEKRFGSGTDRSFRLPSKSRKVKPILAGASMVLAVIVQIACR